jgi:hypothetical protein
MPTEPNNETITLTTSGFTVGYSQKDKSCELMKADFNMPITCFTAFKDRLTESDRVILQDMGITKLGSFIDAQKYFYQKGVPFAERMSIIRAQLDRDFPILKNRSNSGEVEEAINQVNKQPDGVLIITDPNEKLAIAIPRKYLAAITYMTDILNMMGEINHAD